MIGTLIVLTFLAVAFLAFGTGYSVADGKIQAVLAEVEELRKQVKNQPPEPVKRYLEYTGKHLRAVAHHKGLIVHGEN